MRIISLFPAATEIVCALGLRGQLVGISHECDYPEDIAGLPVLTGSALSGAPQDQAAIDKAVAEMLRAGDSIYRVDEDLLAELQPDLILTQELCEVCAVSAVSACRAAGRLANDPRVVSLTPHDLAGVLQNIADVGALTGRETQAAALVAKIREELDWLRAHHTAPPTPLVYLEWLDPFYSAGHWVPELIEIAGGRDLLGRAGEKSRRVFWQELSAADPDVILLGPCGFDAQETWEQYRLSGLKDNPKWQALRAVQENRVYAMDSKQYYSRPGPRLWEETAVLHDLLIVEREWTDRTPISGDMLFDEDAFEAWRAKQWPY